jgi:hypothetical protein
MSRKKELVIGIGEKTDKGIPRVSIYISARNRWFRLDHDEEVLPLITDTTYVDHILIPNYKKHCITFIKDSVSG